MGDGGLRRLEPRLHLRGGAAEEAEGVDEALAPLGLAYPVYPGEYSASLGGNVATNAGGMRAVKYGVTRHQVLGLEAVLPTGEVIRTGGKFVKATTGYDLTQLVIGSEGTLALATEATLRLYPRAPHTATVLAPFPTLDAVTAEPMVDMARQFNSHFRAAVQGYSASEIFSRLQQIRAGLAANGALPIRIAEFDVFASGQPVIGQDSRNSLLHAETLAEGSWGTSTRYDLSGLQSVVAVHRLRAPEWNFLEALAGGANLEAASERLGADAEALLAPLLVRMAAAGVFTGFAA